MKAPQPGRFATHFTPTPAHYFRRDDPPHVDEEIERTIAQLSEGAKQLLARVSQGNWRDAFNHVGYRELVERGLLVVSSRLIQDNPRSLKKRRQLRTSLTPLAERISERLNARAKAARGFAGAAAAFRSRA